MREQHKKEDTLFGYLQLCSLLNRLNYIFASKKKEKQNSMGVFLFDEIIFGPVTSRRLGVSLGINLLPTDSKLCNFNCIYCECGWTKTGEGVKKRFHSRETVRTTLEKKLLAMKQNNEPLDVSTYAGNGEPTLHPQFAEIIDDSIALRNKLFPDVKIAVLSNATMLHNEAVVEALQRVDQNILKIDSAFDRTIRLLNSPQRKVSVATLEKQFAQFDHQFILQTMFLRGMYNDQVVDNATEQEIVTWLKLVERLKPREVMIYTIARDTPTPTLEKVSSDELHAIAKRVNQLGVATQVSV